MANAIYPKFKEALLNQSSNSNLSSGNVKVLLLDTADDTYNSSDEFLSDIVGAGVVANSGNLSNKTFVNGIFDADDAVFTSVTGDQSEALIIYIDTGAPSTSRLVAYFDTGVTGLPVIPNTGNINIQWNASGIFQL